jgi:hypothetical protein
MKLKRLIATLAAAVMLSGAAIGCTEADQVSSNISKQADNFNVTRKLTVLNARTDTVLLELTGTFALKNNSSNELEVIIETAVLVPEDVSYILSDKPDFSVNKFRSDISKFWTVKDCYIIHINTYLSGVPWHYGKETVKAHSFRVAIPYLCHMCSYELKGAFYFGKIF